MITIYKYPLVVEDTQWLDIHRGAKLLSVDVQDGKLYLWAQVDTTQPQDSVLIVIHGTGHPMRKDNMQFIGTFMLYGGSFVGHVFKA